MCTGMFLAFYLFFSYIVKPRIRACASSTSFGLLLFHVSNPRIFCLFVFCYTYFPQRIVLPPNQPQTDPSPRPRISALSSRAPSRVPTTIHLLHKPHQSADTATPALATADRGLFSFLIWSILSCCALFCSDLFFPALLYGSAWLVFFITGLFLF